MAGRPSKDPVDPEIGEKLRAFRMRQRWTQEEAAQIIGIHVNRYSEYERSITEPNPRRVLKLLEEVRLSGKEKRDFIGYLFTPGEESSSILEMMLFGTRPNLNEVPLLARRIYQDAKEVALITEPDDDSGASQVWLKKIFRFPKKQPIWITTSVDTDKQGRDNIPPGDRTAVERIQECLKEVSIESLYGHCRNPKGPKDAKRDIVLACGPAQNTLSKQVNKVLMTENGWFKGFYFYLLDQKGKKTPPGGWTIRCHLLPEEEGIGFPGYPYSVHSLQDGRLQDFGLLYIGPNPLALDNWLVMVAGLGPIGTPGSSLAFMQPRILEFLAKNLRGKRYYCSALVHYHFASERGDEAENGEITSITVVKGEVPSQEFSKSVKLST
jgi:transcriptional regulator with XRE-family HTH domain